MNIVFLTTPASHHFYLINELNKVHPVAKVFYQTHFPGRKRKHSFLKILFTPELLRPRVRRRLKHLFFAKDSQRALAYEREVCFGGENPALDPSIPCESVKTFNKPAGVEKVAAASPDLIIVFGTSILRGAILDLASQAILNIHRDILPNYRGGGLPFWVFLEKDFDNLGTTLHICSKELDGGDIVGQKRLTLRKTDRLHMLRQKTTQLTLETLLEIIPGLEAGTMERRKQIPSRLWRGKDLTIVKEIRARYVFWRHIRSLN